MCNELSHTTGIYTIGFIMYGIYKIALYAVLKSAIDGEILLLPVCVRHVENARTWFPTLLYTTLQRIKFKTITFLNVECVFHSCSCLQR